MNYLTILLHWVIFFLYIVPVPAMAREYDGVEQEIAQLTSKAQAYEMKGEFRAASEQYALLLERSRQTNNRRGMMYWYLGSVFINSQMRNTAQTGQMAARFLQWAREKNETTELAYANYASGMYYRGMMQFDSSFYFIEQAVHLLKKLNDPFLEARVYGALSYNYQKLEMAYESIEYGKKAFSLHQQMNDTAGMAKTLILMAPSFNFLNDLVNWYGHCNEGLRLARLSGNTYLQMLACNNIAFPLFLMGSKIDSGHYYLNEAYRLAQENGYIFDRNDFAISLANKYSTTGNHKKAKEYLEMVFADTARYPLSKPKLHLAQIILYDELKSRGRLAEANEMLERYMELGEEIYQENLASKGRTANYLVKTSDQEKQLGRKQMQVKRQNLLIMAMGLGLLALLFLALYLNKKRQAGKQLLENAKKEQELAAVKAKLNGQLNERHRLSRELHDDLGSSLTSLGLLTETLRREPGYKMNPVVESIAASTLHTIKQMNDILWSVNTSNDTTASLLAHINRFAGDFLQQAGISYTFLDHATQTDAPLTGIVRRNVYLVVKEALNNAVKHASCTAVTMEVNATPSVLHISITDNGKGFQREDTRGGGMGLNNMNDRMREIGGSLQVATETGQTRVEIFFPFDAAAPNKI